MNISGDIFGETATLFEILAYAFLDLIEVVLPRVVSLKMTRLAQQAYRFEFVHVGVTNVCIGHVVYLEALSVRFTARATLAVTFDGLLSYPMPFITLEVFVVSPPPS